MTRLQIVGGGQMGGAILAGLLDAQWASVEELAVVEPSASRREELAGQYSELSIVERPVASEATILAVKPAMIAEVTSQVVGAQGGTLLSIAAGITTAAIEAAAGAPAVVIRAMPNTPALVRKGTSVICRGSGADDASMAWATEVLSAVGSVYEVSESQMDAVTATSGSGPAYVFYLVEALVEGAVHAGLSPELADDLVRDTLAGAAALLASSDRSPGQLRESVTSPGGTTAAALDELHLRGAGPAFSAAVVAAKNRSVELGR